MELISDAENPINRAMSAMSTATTIRITAAASTDAGKPLLRRHRRRTAFRPVSRGIAVCGHLPPPCRARVALKASKSPDEPTATPRRSAIAVARARLAPPMNAFDFLVLVLFALAALAGARAGLS